MEPRQKQHVHNKLVRWLLITGGSISVFLGVLGIFLPLLPTTPFLLLAAACYIRSSDKFYNKLITNKYLAKYIHDYREKKGMELRAKITSISVLWVTILSTAIWAVDQWWITTMLFVIAVGVTIHLLKLRTIPR